MHSYFRFLVEGSGQRHAPSCLTPKEKALIVHLFLTFSCAYVPRQFISSCIHDSPFFFSFLRKETFDLIKAGVHKFPKM
jgi:hypothetical protein